VKPVIPESPPSSLDKGNIVMDGEVPVIPQPLAKLPIRRKPSTCHLFSELGHIRPKCPHQQVQRKINLQAPKTPMCHQCGVSIHVQPRCPPLNHPSIMDLRPEIMFQGISSCRSRLKQKGLGSPRSCMWRNRRLQKGKSSMKEHLLSVLSCKIWLDI